MKIRRQEKTAEQATAKAARVAPGSAFQESPRTAPSRFAGPARPGKVSPANCPGPSRRAGSLSARLFQTGTRAGQPPDHRLLDTRIVVESPSVGVAAVEPSVQGRPWGATIIGWARCPCSGYGRRCPAAPKRQPAI